MFFRVPWSRWISAKAAEQGVICLSEEVRSSLTEKKPIVALESAVITHGMPYPINVQTAVSVEEQVRRNGCVPATIAILGGRIRVGLSGHELQALGECKQSVKMARRDLSAGLIRGTVGGTTVSATMLIAHLAGIRVFCTGGIGGVHRDVTETADISADLIELGRLPVAVVCAGIKAILDIPRTLEFLETHSVPVVTLGVGEPFPGFFFKDSGCESPICLENETQISTFLKLHGKLDSKTGVLIAIPPPDMDSNAVDLIKAAVEQSLNEMGDRKIHGKAVTPFLLRRVNELSNGNALKINIALLENNARAASKIAFHLANLESAACTSRIHPQLKVSANFGNETENSYEVVAIGGASVDIFASAKEEISEDGSTVHGVVRKSFGGVARNVADALTRLGVSTKLISVAGDDEEFRTMKEQCPHMDFSGVLVQPTVQTASYVGLLANNRLQCGLLNDDVYDFLSPKWINRHESVIRNSKMVFIDGDIPVESLSFICNLCQPFGIRVWFDPADRRKTTRAFESGCWRKLKYFSPNKNEFLHCLPQMDLRICSGNPLDAAFFEAFVTQHFRAVLGDLDMLLLTLGKDGIIVASKSQDALPQVTHYKAPKVTLVRNDCGAGDCLNAGIMYGLLQGYTIERCVQFGLRCAEASLLSESTVPDTLNALK
uniref:PfkB domain-containing protein n=1 Tax=Trichuris muris TaxID=70415 RepID=A0A5S6R4V9_TRIMR